MSQTSEDCDPAVLGRKLLRRRDRAALATSMHGAPYASLVLTASDLDASHLLLLSDLAQHSRNIASDPRVSLLIDATEGYSDPLTGPRLTLIGRVAAVEDPRLMARFIGRHPTSATYSGFADFRLYRVLVERAHLVAGFGRIHWIEARNLLFAAPSGALAAAEPEILRHMNADHAGAIRNFAQRLLGRSGADWHMTGIDPEGIDLRCGGEIARLNFAEPALTPEAARAALVELTHKAQK